MDERNKGTKYGREGLSSRLESRAGSTDWGGDSSVEEQPLEAGETRKGLEMAMCGEVFKEERKIDYVKWCSVWMHTEKWSLCEWKILPAMSVNKACCSHQVITLQPPDGEPWGNSGWNPDAPHLSVSCCSNSNGTLWGYLWEARILTPNQRYDFSGPRLLHLPIHRKALNSLTWNIQFSLINRNLLMGFPHSSVGNESACNAGAPGLILGSERSPGEGNGNLLQYSCLGNPMGRRAWRAIVHKVTRDGHNSATKPLPLFWCSDYLVFVVKLIYPGPPSPSLSLQRSSQNFVRCCAPG